MQNGLCKYALKVKVYASIPFCLSQDDVERKVTNVECHREIEEECHSEYKRECPDHQTGVKNRAGVCLPCPQCTRTGELCVNGAKKIVATLQVGMQERSLQVTSEVGDSR